MTDPTPQRLVIWRLTVTETRWRQMIPQMPTAARNALPDQYFDLAANNRQSGGRCYENLIDFAWRLNDLVAEYHHDIRHPKKLRTPAYAATLRQARQRGMVPTPIDGSHVEIGFCFGYAPAARAAFIVVRRDEDDPYTLDFRWLAGLDVRILATAADWHCIDPLARCLAYQGARNVSMRRLDRPGDDEILYRGARPWRL
ncbi:MAG: hypothetical protein KKF85_15440 [Gammaproteobacteria bacterium]|nr:hypothetical protein [Rhodocyclaceae bacterium]MBU3907940.1 hypothetical protein [Gammaproteobacteria bacterium]MBU3989782.1 hypothetical protein [Gammaproteobacteria bacterium]MBU4003846.1 hypothetical protein [Gammaproteobacteria bacterium]MBU4021724.1 hypothetical protein [Gammaproteobacteria bacterium]